VGGPMSEVLVLQLCRLGDILQTTPMLRGIRRDRPGARVTLVVHDGFRHAPVPSALYDRLVGYPQTAIERAMAEDPLAWAREAERIGAWIDDLGGPFDEVLNLTHSDQSGLLTSLIPSKSLQGSFIAPDRRRIVRGPWMAYFWASQQSRAQGCFNLVDIYTRAAGVAHDRSPLDIEVGPDAKRVAGEWLSAHGLSGRPIIAVQLGASEERKRWPPELFAEAVDRLSPDLGEIVLVGTADEQPLSARATRRAGRRLFSAVGQTSIQELAALLGQCRLLLSNDTGTMHVASAVGTRVVDLSTGPVYVHETAPYGSGHVVVEPCVSCFPCAARADCRHFACRDLITPVDVAALVSHVLGRGPMPRPADARIMRGRFAESGRIVYDVAWTPRPNLDEVVREASASMWEESLVAGSAPAPTGGRRHKDQARFPKAANELTQTLRQLAHCAEGVARSAARLGRVAGTRTQTSVADIARELDALELMGQLDALCKPIVAYLRTRLDCIETTEIAAVAREYSIECAASAALARRLAQLLDLSCAAFGNIELCRLAAS
jgi:ADP-heptose:LPS heptosyltransferase